MIEKYWKMGVSWSGEDMKISEYGFFLDPSDNDSIEEFYHYFKILKDAHPNSRFSVKFTEYTKDEDGQS